MMTDFFHTENAKKVFDDLNHTGKDVALETRLTSIAAKQGLPYLEANQAAREILQVFQPHYAATQEFSTDGDKALDRFFDFLDASALREQCLGALNASLTLADDPEARKRLFTDARDLEMKRLHKQCYIPAWEDYHKVRDEVREGLRRLNLSKEPMEKLLDGLNRRGVCTESSLIWEAEDIREHMARGTITAMRLYLSNRKDISPAEAALTVCTTREAMVFHDAIISGQESMQEVQDLLMDGFLFSILVAVIIILCGALLWREELLWVLLSAALLVVEGGLFALASHPVGAWLGRAKIQVNNDQTRVSEERQENTVEQTQALKDPFGLFDVHNYEAWDELTDNALVF